jgi:hypothetical protein
MEDSLELPRIFTLNVVLGFGLGTSTHCGRSAHIRVYKARVRALLHTCRESRSLCLAIDSMGFDVSRDVISTPSSVVDIESPPGGVGKDSDEVEDDSGGGGGGEHGSKDGCADTDENRDRQNAPANENTERDLGRYWEDIVNLQKSKHKTQSQCVHESVVQGFKKAVYWDPDTDIALLNYRMQWRNVDLKEAAYLWSSHGYFYPS